MQSEVTQQTEKVDAIHMRAHLVILGREYYSMKRTEDNFVRIEAESKNAHVDLALSVSNGSALKALIEDLTALYQESEN